MSADRILRLRDVQARLGGLSKTTIYDFINAGQFPRPVRLGPRAVGWRESEVSEWIESRPKADVS